MVADTVVVPYLADSEVAHALRGQVLRTASDATKVVLAEAFDCVLLTADARLAAATGPRCPFTVVRR